MTEPYDAERLRKCSIALEILRDGLSVTHGSLDKAAKLYSSLKRMITITDQAATALTAQAEQLAILRTEVEDMRAKAVSNAQERNAAQREVAAQAEEIERLRKALNMAVYELIACPGLFRIEGAAEAASNARAALGGKQDD